MPRRPQQAEQHHPPPFAAERRREENNGPPFVGYPLPLPCQGFFSLRAQSAGRALLLCVLVGGCWLCCWVVCGVEEPPPSSIHPSRLPAFIVMPACLCVICSPRQQSVRAACADPGVQGAAAACTQRTHKRSASCLCLGARRSEGCLPAPSQSNQSHHAAACCLAQPASYHGQKDSLPRPACCDS